MRSCSLIILLKITSREVQCVLCTQCAQTPFSLCRTKYAMQTYLPKEEKLLPCAACWLKVGSSSRPLGWSILVQFQLEISTSNTLVYALGTSKINLNSKQHIKHDQTHQDTQARFKAKLSTVLDV